MSPHFRSRVGSVVQAAGALRRASHAVLEHVDPLHEIGNPLDLKINEVKRVSAAIFPRHESFDGRKAPAIGQLPRKPSLYPSDVPEIEDTSRAEDDPDDYFIKRIASRDDIDHIPKWKRFLYMTSPFWGLLTLAAFFAYLSMRIKSTFDAQKKNNTVFGLAWTFIAIEFGVAVPMLLHRTWSL